jgi:hypothetical protein
MAALSRHRPLSIEKALFYLEQVCSGLAHAHECGVIHRDIKPQNLLLTAGRQIVKIADFGVARLEASEGAITRVGTNIYSAPEHNPLVQTGQLDTGALLIDHEHLTPAADIYSLAKTTYTLLAGESPRRFAQHAIRDLPPAIADHFWAQPILRVLEKATQTRPENRYQTVQEFWDELAEAALPPTKLLEEVAPADARRRPSCDLSVEPEDVPAAPPEPRFEPVHASDVSDDLVEQTDVARAHVPSYIPRVTGGEPERRPKIVVPVSVIQTKARGHEAIERGRSANQRLTAVPSEPQNGKPVKERLGHPRRPAGSRQKRSLVVAAVLILAFTGMLLATHKYVTSHWNPFVGLPTMGDVFVIGREGVTTTDVNLRSEASTGNPPVGLAESGSRVKVLATDNNWYEVQVLEHGRAKADPFTSDRGWINKKFVKFN